MAWCLAWGSAAAAQSTTPILLVQPGMATADFLSSPNDDPASTGFNLRVVGLLPTRVSWLTLIVGANVTPYGTSGATRRNNNSPVLFAGNVFPVLRSARTAGWLSIDAPLLLTYSLGGGGEHNTDPYGKDFSVETAFTLHLGRKLLSGFGGPLSHLRLYGILDQTLTPNTGFDGKRDRFNPVAYYGLTLAFGTGRESP